MYQAPFADVVRNEVGIPTITVGNISTADQVNTLLAGGRADLFALGRGHLATRTSRCAPRSSRATARDFVPSPYGIVRAMGRPG